MNGISTHVLDTGVGRPAAGVTVTLERWELDAWLPCSSAVTDADGRCSGMLAAEHVSAGRYRLNFATGDYFARDGRPTFFPEVSISFHVEQGCTRHHVPLLLSGFGYATYRGS